jgi:predicted amino acid racemase
MIEENILNSEMSSKLKKVEQFLESKFIFCTKNWLKDKVEIHKNSNKIEDKILSEIISSDISNFIDIEKVTAHCKISDFAKFDIKEKKINKNIFFQIKGYSNIAEPSEKVDKSGDIDVLENFDSKYLQSEGEENKKSEKVVLKFELTDGVETIYGFEYEDLKDLKKNLISSENKFVKVVVGPNFEVRRGIIYLKNDNINLL